MAALTICSDFQFSFSSVAQSCPTLCNPMNRSLPGLPVHHQLPESMQTHVHRVGDAIQPSHPLSSPSPPALNLSQHQGLFKWVSSSYQGAKVIKSVTVSIVSPSICHEVMGPYALIFIFWMLSFKPTFSLSSFTFIKRLLSSLLSAISVVSSAYLRLLIFLPAILIPSCASSSPAFLMMYSTYKLNISKVAIYSLDILLSQFGTSLFFHVLFKLLLLDLHTNFSEGRSGGLVFPCL